MNFAAVFHEAKSRYAYAYDKETLHIRLRTAKSDIDRTELIWGDPFDWRQREDDADVWEWNPKQIQTLEMKKEYSDELFDYWFVALKAPWKRVKYSFILYKEGQEQQYGTRGFTDLKKDDSKKFVLQEYFNFPYLNFEDVFDAPEWVKDTVWYQIFPERFANGDKSINLKGTLEWDCKDEVGNEMLFGGDLQGIIDHLDYIKDLGIGGIYFTPIFEAHSTHKYDTIDYFKIDPCFGSNETFKVLMDEAHKRGIKVMLDAVFNHCGYDHPFWQDVVEKGRESKYYDCFYIKEDPVIDFELVDGRPPKNFRHLIGNLNYETFGFTPFMPKLKTDHPLIKEHLMEVSKYWIEEYDIDGWRLDVSNEVSHDFWREFRKTVKGIKPDLYVLGENWDDAYPWLAGDQFDASMNYSFLTAVWRLLGHKEHTEINYTVAEFKNAIGNLLANYPKHLAQYMFNLLDSHDTTRLLTVCDNDVEKLKLAYLIQMTFSGSPSIYYGSEIGLKGVGDGNRMCMVWENEGRNVDIYDHVKKLTELRKENSAFKAVDIHWHECVNSENVLIYSKQTEEQKIFVLMNVGDGDIEIQLPEALKNKEFKDLYNNNSLKLGSVITIEKSDFLLLKS